MTDLTTVAAVKAYLGLTTTTDDAVIASLVTAYSEWVRSITNRDFNVQAYSIWRSGRNSNILPVPQWPIISIQSLTVGTSTIPAASKVGAYGYRFDDRAIVLDGGALFSMGTQNINLQYTAGYASVPVDIAQAVNELVGLRYRLRDKLEWTSKGLAGETVSLNTKDMPASVATVLRQYTNPVPL